MLQTCTVKEPWGKDLSTLQFTPPLSKPMFLDVIETFQVKHIAWEKEGDLNAAELAAYLNCPVVSGESDFYLFTPDQPMPSYCFIPLDSICWKVKPLRVQCERCQTLQKSCMVLSCKTFCLSESPLKYLNPKLFPLLSLLLGNDYAKCEFQIDGVPRENCPAEWPKRLREIDARLNCLRQFNNDDLIKPLDAALTHVDKAAKFSGERTVRIDVSLHPRSAWFRSRNGSVSSLITATLLFNLGPS